MEHKEFSFCISIPRYAKKNKNVISTYTYGQEVFSGTLKDAENIREIIENRVNFDKKKKEKYFIYKLVKVELDKSDEK